MMNRSSGLVSQKRILSYFALVCTGLALAGCTGSSAPTANSKKGDGVVPVNVATASLKTVPIDIGVIGNVEAYSTIGVKSLVGGELVTVHFQEGDTVKKGDLLFNVDRRPFDAMVSQAQANLARDTAALS